MAHPIFDVSQDCSGKYSFTVVGADNVAVPDTDIDQLLLTLYDTTDETIINGRDQQNVLNANDVTMDCAGNVEWSYGPLDMPRLHDTRTPEKHTALFKIVWNSGNSQILHEVSFRIQKITIPT